LNAGEQSKVGISTALGQKEISGQLNHVIRNLIDDELIDRTIPDKPQSRLQKYRLTDKGRAVLASTK
jgi:ATP-dependent DNA helicase RecG